MARRPRIAVIGAGIIGTSVASALAARGASVTVIEAALPGAGTTSTSLAWVNASSKVDASPEQLDLALRATADYRSQASALAPFFHPTGGIDIRWEAAEVDHLKSKVVRLQEAGYAAELLPVRALEQLEPGLDPPATAVGAHYPDEAWVDAPAMARALLERAQGSGATARLSTAANDLVLKNDAVTGVALAHGELLRADVVVAATGRWTRDFLGRVGIDVPLAGVESPESKAVGLLASVLPASRQPRTVLHSPHVNWAPRPAGGAVLASASADRTIARDGSPESVRTTAEALLERAAELSACFVGASLEHARIGLRALPIDERPICGWINPIGGLYVVVAHSGITLAPLLSRLAAKEIVEGVEASGLEPFRPSRFDGAAGEGAAATDASR